MKLPKLLKWFSVARLFITKSFVATLLAITLGFTTVTSSLAFAHQQKTAITTILFNPRTQNIEVMHRFNMHDAEHAVREIFDKKADIISSADTQKRFALYVGERFHLATQDGQLLNLASVGYEAEGKFFWVYQETSQISDLDSLLVQHDALRDLWPSQTNTVNIEGNGKIKTLTFTENIELLKVEFESSDSHHNSK